MSQFPPFAYTGPAMWSNNSHDEPVIITGYAGMQNGIRYFTIAGSATGIPETQLRPALDVGNLLQRTDLANAGRFEKRNGSKVLYVAEWGWLVWDGRRWEQDKRNQVMQLAKGTAQSIYAEAQHAGTDDEAKALAGWAAKSQDKTRLEAMVALARSAPSLVARPEEFDTDPWLLNVNNGTVDLRSGKLLPHSRAHRITRLAPVDFDPEAECPRWEQFLHEVFDSKELLIRFVQKAVGYSLTGDTSEQCLFFPYGLGDNGKSVLINIVQQLMSDYAAKIRVETVMSRQQQDSIPNDIARLAGVRFVVGSEIERGKRLNESLIKDLTGQDVITARFLRKEFFDFRPVFKLWLYGNHKPIVRGTDHGIWRRIRLVPFTVQIPKDKQDKRLAEKLTAELPGILAWAVRGCLLWQQEGLQPPDEVAEATKSYKSEMDLLGTFIDECCVLNPLAKARKGDVFSEYQKWAKLSGYEPVGKIEFGRMLAERNGIQDAKESNGWKWIGLGLVDNKHDNKHDDDPECDK